MWHREAGRALGKAIFAIALFAGTAYAALPAISPSASGALLSAQGASEWFEECTTGVTCPNMTGNKCERLLDTGPCITSVPCTTGCVNPNTDDYCDSWALDTCTAGNEPMPCGMGQMGQCRADTCTCRSLQTPLMCTGATRTCW